MLLKTVIGLVTLVITQTAFAQGRIYTVIDNEGHITISNKPLANSKPPKPSQSSKTVNTNHEKHGSGGKFSYFYKYLDTDGNYLYTDKPKDDFTLLSKTKVRVHEIVPSLLQTAYRPSPVRRNWLFVQENKSRFNELIAQTAAKHQVDVNLVHAVIQTESAYDASAISSAGAVGLMQLMPDTARRFGVNDRLIPEQNIEGGIRYLRHLMNLFPNSLDLAVAAYNAGENAVMRHNNTIPPYPETMNYVKQVLALYNNK